MSIASCYSVAEIVCSTYIGILRWILFSPKYKEKYSKVQIKANATFFP